MVVHGISVYKSKAEAIRSWPTPKSIHSVWSFHGLALFYRIFIRNFSTIMAPLTKVIQHSSLKWIPEAQEAF